MSAVILWIPETETSIWSAEEVEAYQQAMMKYDKDFFLVSKQVKTCMRCIQMLTVSL